MMLSAEELERAGQFLLRVLRDNGGRIHFKHFYDGTWETYLGLRQGLGIEKGSHNWDCAERILESTAFLMEEQGYLRKVPLDEKLADGTDAFTMRLTDAGRAWLASGQEPTFCDDTEV